MLNWLRFIYIKPLLIFLLCQQLYFQVYSQHQIGFAMPAGVKRMEIPFQEFSNLIVIPITINGFLTVRFILDTGAESAILTEKALGDLLNLQYVREIGIAGPGLVDSLHAYVASNVQLSLPFGVHGFGMNMLVLKDDYLELSKNLGEEIYGIIGYDVFSRFVVQIDYDNDVLILHDPQYFQPRKSSTVVPIEIRSTKPYVRSWVSQDQNVDSVKLLIDTGASHALLLDVESTDEIALPNKLLAARLGQGLGGEIPGYIGRMQACRLNRFDFEDVLVSLPMAGAYIKAIKRGSRHGTIGGDLLSRFMVTIDYQKEKMYLKKGTHFKDEFEFDMSGMTIGAEGANLDSLVVLNIRSDTPASKAGIKKGDLITSLNGFNLGNSTLSEINAFLRKREGLRIKIKIRRGDTKIKRSFRLERMI